MESHPSQPSGRDRGSPQGSEEVNAPASVEKPATMRAFSLRLVWTNDKVRHGLQGKKCRDSPLSTRCGPYPSAASWTFAACVALPGRRSKEQSESYQGC